MINLERIPCAAITDRVANHQANRLYVNNEFPEVILTRYNSQNTRENFSTKDELTNCRVVIFTVPGAYTPTCTGTHLAGFKQTVSKILELGIDKIICITPDNPDVANAWNLAHGDPSIKMWADNLGELTDKIGLGQNLSGNRALAYALKRSAMIVNNRKVEWIEVETSGANCGISHANNVIRYLQSVSSQNAQNKQ